MLGYYYFLYVFQALYFFFSSVFGRLVILPRYDLKRRHPVVPHRDSRQWLVRIWSLRGNKVCLGFYLQSRSICNSIARVGFGHVLEAPMSFLLNASLAQPCQWHPGLAAGALNVLWPSPPSSRMDRGRQTWLELSSHWTQNPLLPSPCGNSAPKVKKEGLWCGTELCGERQMTALGVLAGQAHLPCCPTCTTENDTATLTAYEKISTFLAFLCDQVWQQYTCVQNWSNLLSLNATYRLIFSEIILIKSMVDGGQSVHLEQSAKFLYAYFDFCKVTICSQDSCIHCLITVPLYMILHL